MQLNAYLTFNGQCRAAFEYYAKVFGGKLSVMTHRDSPVADQTSPEWLDAILHARLEVGDAVLMGSDAPPQYQQTAQGFSVSVQADSPAEGERIFNALADKGQVRMAYEKTFWAERFGMCVDQFGTPWMVNVEGART